MPNTWSDKVAEISADIQHAFPAGSNMSVKENIKRRNCMRCVFDYLAAKRIKCALLRSPVH